MIVYSTRYLGPPLSPQSPPANTQSLYSTLHIDIFWNYGSLYNTIFKLLFLGFQSYTIYLMLNDYKPTHDPNIDTFKVQYLLGGSAVLAILFPYKYQITEVRPSPIVNPSLYLSTRNHPTNSHSPPP